jgi:hypothetical protein
MPAGSARPLAKGFYERLNGVTIYVFIHFGGPGQGQTGGSKDSDELHRPRSPRIALARSKGIGGFLQLAP